MAAFVRTGSTRRNLNEKGLPDHSNPAAIERLADGAIYTQQQHTTADNTVNHGPIQPIYNISITEHNHHTNYNHGYDSNFHQQLFH